MLANNLQKLKSSLNETIEKWMDENSETEGWSDLDTYVGDYTGELMTDAAFTVLLAQKQLTEYYKENNLLKD